jgi:hypothetical protein
MADSAILSRLPARGAAAESVGIPDAFKIPLLDAEGKIHFSLLSNSSGIYSAANTAERLAQGAATPGDFCLQADNDSIYFLKAAPPSLENNWIRLSTVTSTQEDFDSPEFTGIPTAPTAAITAKSTQIATTAFVKNLAASATPLADLGTGAVGVSLKYALEDHRHPTDTTRAPIDSPSFTGTPTAVSPDNDDDGTRIATTHYVKQQALNEFAVRGNLNANNWRITSLAPPVNAGDAVPKSYVDAVQTGLTIREPVKVATPETAGNISLTGTVTTLDGVTLAPGDRVLVKHQNNASRNGIYVVNLGSPWVRSADADSSGEMRNGFCVTATHGDVGANTSWVLVNEGNVVLNSTPINFVYFTTQLGSVGGGAGREIELRKTATHIQWHYVDEASWTDLIALSDLTSLPEDGIIDCGIY